MASKMIHISGLHVILMLLALYYPARAQEDTCHLGTYKQTNGPSQEYACMECPDGTFMPQVDHTNTKCFDCTEIENPNVEIMISPCTKTRDADIQCVDGYYRVLAGNPRSKPVCKECDPCHKLLHEIRRCQNYSNTWCCPDVNYDYEYDKHGIALCRERPWICRKGQYMDTSINDCKPCPRGTFMPEDYHSYTECWNCQYHSEADLPLHTKITQQCNSTHPTVYACKEGYYINHSLSYRGDDIGCLPCTSCTDGMFVGRQCDKFQDTVCCYHDSMVVVDDFNQVRCIEGKNKTSSTSDDSGPLSGENMPATTETTKITVKFTDPEGLANCEGDRKGDIYWPMLVGLIVALLAVAGLVFLIIRKQRNYVNSTGKRWLKTRAKALFDKSVKLDTGVKGSGIELGMWTGQPEENEGLVKKSRGRFFIALLGKTGSGKSTTGNTILGKSIFTCCDSMSSVTREVVTGNSEFSGTHLTVADIPDIEEGLAEIDKVQNALISLFRKSQKGIFVVIFIVKYGGRFTKDDTKMLEMLRSKFGNNFIKNHVFVIMTFGDMFEKNKIRQSQTFEMWCADQNGPFADLIKECDQRVSLFDNTVGVEKRKEKYVQDLIEKLNNITDQGPHIRKRFLQEEGENRSQETMEVDINFDTDNAGANVEKNSTIDEVKAETVGFMTNAKFRDRDEIEIQSMGNLGVGENRKKPQRDYRVQERNVFFLGPQRCYETEHERLDVIKV